MLCSANILGEALAIHRSFRIKRGMIELVSWRALARFAHYAAFFVHPPRIAPITQSPTSG